MEPTVIDEKAKQAGPILPGPVTNAPAPPPVPATMTTMRAENHSAIARPIVTPEVAKQVIQEWEDLKKAIGMESDIRRETRKSRQPDGSYKDMPVAYYKKSYWRKAATFLGLSVEAQENTEQFRTINELRLASVVYRATGPNGRAVSGDGHCGSDEGGKKMWSASNLLSTAHTRAYNRAVSNYIGGGEVSADELDEDGSAAEIAAVSALARDKMVAELRTHKTLDSLKAYWEASKDQRTHLTQGDLTSVAATKDEVRDFLKGAANVGTEK